MADLKSTFSPDRSLVTSSPGFQAPAFPGLSMETLAMLLAGQRGPADGVGAGAVGAAKGAGRMRGGGPSYDEIVNGQAPQARPTLGQAPLNQEQYPTRMVRDPYYKGATQYGAGNQAYRADPVPMVKERMIDGKWEFDNIDPSRQGSGGPGRIQGDSSIPGQTIKRDDIEGRFMEATRQANARQADDLRRLAQPAYTPTAARRVL